MEDDGFETYMKNLFRVSRKYVIVYSSNVDKEHLLAHVKHRRFTDWVEENASEWRLQEVIENRYPAGLEDSFYDRSFAQFYIFERSESHPDRS